MRFKSNLPLTEVNKILKNLESKKLIKAVKSVAVSSVYVCVCVCVCGIPLRGRCTCCNVCVGRLEGL